MFPQTVMGQFLNFTAELHTLWAQTWREAPTVSPDKSKRTSADESLCWIVSHINTNPEHTPSSGICLSLCMPRPWRAQRRWKLCWSLLPDFNFPSLTPAISGFWECVLECGVHSKICDANISHSHLYPVNWGQCIYCCRRVTLHRCN